MIEHTPDYGAKDATGRVVKRPQRCAWTDRPIAHGGVNVPLTADRRFFYRLSPTGQRAMTPVRRAQLQDAVTKAIERAELDAVEPVAESVQQEAENTKESPPEFGYLEDLPLSETVIATLKVNGVNNTDELLSAVIEGHITAIKGIGPATRDNIVEALEGLELL